MLSLNQTFDETRSIKVLVVPIGTNSLFDEHFQVVSNLRDVPFYELNRPPAVPNQSSPFRYFNWNDGNLLFEFQRYDRVLIGPGDLNNFQSSKRILMIMGLINYPELGATADRIEEEMEYFARRHPNILLRRLFVFNYSFDDPLAHSMVTPLMARIRDPASLVIFPPEGQCGATASGSADGLGEAQVSQEEGLSMVDVHLTEVMSHAALHIVLALEQQLRLCEESRVRNILPEGLPMCTIFDDVEDSATPRDGGPSSAMSKQSSAGKKPTPAPYKKKPSGRIHKWMGDVCMQACSPRDALEHYAAAITECRALNETLWLAGALEGYASAVLLLVLRSANIEEILGKELRGVVVPVAEGTQPSESAVDKAVRLAEERAADALAIYATNIVYCAMEVECLLRLARTLESSAPVGSNREARVMDYIFRAVTVPGLNTQQQIEVTLEGGLRCHRLGLWRKYALFLYIAALMSADNENYGVAHALIRYACNECGISTNADGLTPSQMARSPQKGNIGSVPPDSHGGLSSSGPAVSGKNSVWDSLRGTLYSTAALIADEHGDTLSATHYLVGLMRLIQDGEDAHAEQRGQWQQFAPRRLFADEKLLPPGVSRAARSGSRIGVPDLSTERSVRWEGDSAKVTMVTNPSTESFAGDRSPVPRRSRTGDASDGSMQAAGSGVNTSESESGRSPPPVPQKSNSPMVPRKLPMAETSSSASASASYENDREREMARYRLQAQGGSAPDTTESAADTRTGTGGNSEGVLPGSMGGRSLSVPTLPERLNALSHITHPPTKTSSLAVEPSTGSGSRPAGQTQSDFLIERLMRTIAPQDSGPVFGSPAPAGGGVGGREDGSGALAVDAVEAMAQLLAASRYPRELQEETHGLFARLSKSIAPSSRVALPVSLVTLRPRELVGCAKPVPVTSSAAAAAKANLALHKQRLLAGDASGGTASGQLTPTGDNSSLFYDPFAAKRQRQLAQTQKNEVLWAVGQQSSFVAVLSNPLCVPVFLTSVFPVLSGGEHTIYPVAVHIPPNVERYEVELFVLPKAVGALQVEGLQFVVNNATHVLRVDKEGNLVDPESTSAKAPKKLTSAESVAAASSEPVATNAISVVPACVPLRLDTSWADVAEASAAVPSSWPHADALRHLTLSPGELREEVVWLSAVPPESLIAEKSAAETHFRVAIRQAQTATGAQGKTLSSPSVLCAYTGALGGSEGVVSRPFCTVQSQSHNPCPAPPSCASDTACSPVASILASLALSLQHDVSVDVFDLEVEVCSSPPRVLRAIEVFKQEGCAGSEADELATALDASELALYARTYRLRVMLRRSPCVALRSLALVQSAIAMPVPQYEVARLRQALRKLLGGCAALRKDQKDTGKEGLIVSLAPKYLQVWAEVENKSDWTTSVHVLPDNGGAVAVASGEQELACPGQVLDSSQLGAESGALLQLPPHSVRGVVLRYHSSACDPAPPREVAAQRLKWSCRDLSRVFQTPESDGCVLPQAPMRRGAVQLQDAPVDLSRQSAQLAPIIRAVPCIVVTTILSSSGGCQRGAGAGELPAPSQVLTAVQDDPSRGDMFAVSAGKFYDIAIAVCNCMVDNAVEVELALCVVSNDVPLLAVQDNEREPQATSSAAGRAGSVLASTVPQSAAEYLLTGKSYGRYSLSSKDSADSATGEPVVHRVRLCFPKPGSFTIYPVMRALSLESEGWWCSEGSYVRVVSS